MACGDGICLPKNFPNFSGYTLSSVANAGCTTAQLLETPDNLVPDCGYIAFVGIDKNTSCVVNNREIGKITNVVRSGNIATVTFDIIDGNSGCDATVVAGGTVYQHNTNEVVVINDITQTPANLICEIIEEMCANATPAVTCGRTLVGDASNQGVAMRTYDHILSPEDVGIVDQVYAWGRPSSGGSGTSMEGGFDYSEGGTLQRKYIINDQVIATFNQPYPAPCGMKWMVRADVYWTSRWEANSISSAGEVAMGIILGVNESTTENDFAGERNFSTSKHRMTLDTDMDGNTLNNQLRTHVPIYREINASGNQLKAMIFATRYNNLSTSGLLYYTEGQVYLHFFLVAA